LIVGQHLQLPTKHRAQQNNVPNVRKKMQVVKIWKNCVLCDATYREDQAAEHIKIWHTKKEDK
jgi:hypothetical protein